MSRRSRTGRVSAGAAGLALGLLLCLPAQAAEPVDVELVLAVDVSLSMSPAELEIQRAGYASALRDKSVMDAIRSGMNGRIAITYFEWAGNATHHVIVPWTVIATPQDAERVATQLTASPPNSARRTSISAALEFAKDMFAESSFTSPRRVVDVSGDGPNNQGAPVTEIRDRLVAQGVVINGLPLMTNGGLDTGYDVGDLDVYYTRCVIGGPGAFMIPVNAWEQFPEAVRRKLVLELAGDRPKVVPAQFTPGQGSEQSRDGYDCMVGEKMWRNRSWMWDSR